MFAEQLGAQPKELEKVQKKLLRDQGSKLRRKTAQQARATGQPHSGAPQRV